MWRRAVLRTKENVEEADCKVKKKKKKTISGRSTKLQQHCVFLKVSYEVLAVS